MVNVEVVEKFQLEFDLYETRKDFSLGGVSRELYRNLEEVDVARSFVDLEKSRNKRRRFISGVLGKYAERFGYFDAHYYDMDDAFLDRKRAMLDVYYGQLHSISSRLNNDNFTELYRFMSFTRRKNRDFRVLVEAERDALKKCASGEDVEIPASSNEHEQFNEWFAGALEKVSYTERVVKEKK